MGERGVRAVFLTGRPGVGKTTVLLKAVELLKSLGARVGGMVSQEVREEGVRVGFELIDISTGQKGWLAHVRQREGPKLGKYRVNISDLDRIGVRAILKAVEEADIVVIDEVGPMELFSERFREAVKLALRSGKPIIGTIHWRARDPLLDEIRRSPFVKVITVRPANRDELPGLIADELRPLLKTSGGESENGG